jgi:hypothetical protein
VPLALIKTTPLLHRLLSASIITSDNAGKLYSSQ